MSMNIREAAIADIEQIQLVRNSVRENRLSDPALVTDKHCEEFLTNRGKGWVCEINDRIVGFAIADLRDKNIWALFVLPEFEQKGIGKKLHDIMLGWYFAQGMPYVWLSTEADTRAENFYRKAGWVAHGIHNKNEIKFEMTFENWKNFNTV